MSVVTRGDLGSIRGAGLTRGRGRTEEAGRTGGAEAIRGAEADPTEPEGTLSIFQEKVYF